ncbi:MAG: hypothetical protein RMK64_02675 [Rhodovarius sp.]|nr:hypothetical protein [Rhodovarius sp.]MCX7931097.1 hypothetical protein [Rhodovarius sp.]MDW8313853.1 hypothetical protein [Rhodovarius sp.]
MSHRITLADPKPSRPALRRLAPLGILLLLLAGCGHRPIDRALSGGLIGAGAGAGVAAVAGGPVLGAAAVGAAAGAVTGAVTSPRSIDLGRPVWR